ncbi:ubiquinol-cytochrome c reductase iron-sulfur subunit [Acetobacteraceae bacterium KSS8]|uniref:Ubiquinol-cytochrome c reductase iron-sulfur subunit n=1 Tax=Endosaccharibacter trunci TaxID=2812733 RepID=A0ABT1W2V1_9PROT|nr:ubiquinol-cytochrome c reductase iron-sulfur subunit [Acetobacteraceae bacterium KSS8]
MVEASETVATDVADAATEPKRRDFLTLVTLAATGVAACGFVWPFLDSLNRTDPGAAAAPVDVDLSTLRPGQQVVVVWGGKPVFVVRRGGEALQRLQDPALDRRLRDPGSHEKQQPRYADNWHRSIVPEYGVLVGICTHLGCVPKFRPVPDPGAGFPGGYACPCHGSRFDLAGRVLSGSPALYNLPVPPYSMLNATRLRIGENAREPGYSLDDVRQL